MSRVVVRRWLAAALGGLALSPLLALLSAGPAQAALAHPLGNFTVNTADRLVVTAAGVEALHVLDLAEIPTVQLRGQIAAAGGLDRYAERECARVAPLLGLTVDGAPAPLTPQSAAGEVRPGAGGLTTTRLECRLRSDRAVRESLAFTDGSIEDRVGWREVTLDARCGTLTGSDVPARSVSDLLTRYPADLLTSPLDVRSAQARYRAGPCSGGAEGADGAAGSVAQALPRGVGGVTAFFTDFLGRRDLTVGFAVLSVLASLAFGVVHALAPGHGKTVMAAYLVGQRGNRRQAVQLGAVVTFTHTASVLLLGALLTAGTLAAPERAVPLTEILSGLLLAALGGYLLVQAVRRVRLRRADHPHDHDHEHPHDHDHEHHDHDHDHDHPHDHAPAAGLAHTHGGITHTHAPLPEGPLRWRTLAGMGVAGGLVPSPSALVVLLGATALGRAWFGVLLVLVYGLGMAVTLTAAGLLLLRAQAALDRRGWVLGRGRNLGRLLPVGTAAVVVLVGVGLVARGVVTGRGLL